MDTDCWLGSNFGRSQAQPYESPPPSKSVRLPGLTSSEVRHLDSLSASRILILMKGRCVEMWFGNKGVWRLIYDLLFGFVMGCSEQEIVVTALLIIVCCVLSD